LESISVLGNTLPKINPVLAVVLYLTWWSSDKYEKVSN